MNRLNLGRRQASDFSFGTGQLFRRGDTLFRIVEERGALLKLENTASLELKVQDKALLMVDYSRGLLVPAVEDDAQPLVSGAASTDEIERVLEGLPLDMHSPAQTLQVRTIMRFIFELRRLGYQSLRPTPLLELEFNRLQSRLAAEPGAQLKPLTLSTIYKWSLRYDEAGGDVRAVIPQFHERGGRGKTRTGGIADAAFAKVFSQLREDRKARVRPYEVESRVKYVLQQEIGPEQVPLVMPARSTVVRRIRKEFSAYELTVRNKGKAIADREFRTWYPRDRAEWPLEVVEFDDKDARIFLIDEVAGLPYGRAFVTCGVDQHSGIPLGTSISELHRSTWSAICALTNAITPKDRGNLEYALVESGLEFAGKPGIALFDNATYNHAHEIDEAAYELGLHPAWAKPRTPTEKSTIENFNGRMDQYLFSKLPGYAGHKSDRAGLAEGTATANISKLEFQQLLHRWIYDDYCNSPGQDGLTPRQRWHEKMRLVQPRFPLDIYRLRIAPTLRHSVHFRSEGILFTGLIYQSDHLIKLRKNLGAKALIGFRYDPRDMSLIYVLDAATRQLFLVPSAQPEYTQGLTLYQHRLIRKMACQRYGTNPSIPQLLQSREELRVLVQQSRYSTRKRERFFAQKAGNVVASRNDDKVIKPKKVVMTDLEGQVNDIDDVEMEIGDEGWEVPELI